MGANRFENPLAMLTGATRRIQGITLLRILAENFKVLIAFALFFLENLYEHPARAAREAGITPLLRKMCSTGTSRCVRPPLPLFSARLDDRHLSVSADCAGGTGLLETCRLAGILIASATSQLSARVAAWEMPQIVVSKLRSSDGEGTF